MVAFCLHLPRFFHTKRPSENHSCQTNFVALVASLAQTLDAFLVEFGWARIQIQEVWAILVSSASRPILHTVAVLCCYTSMTNGLLLLVLGQFPPYPKFEAYDDTGYDSIANLGSFWQVLICTTNHHT